MISRHWNALDFKHICGKWVSSGLRHSTAADVSQLLQHTAPSRHPFILSVLFPGLTNAENTQAALITSITQAFLNGTTFGVWQVPIRSRKGTLPIHNTKLTSLCKQSNAHTYRVGAQLISPRPPPPHAGGDSRHGPKTSTQPLALQDQETGTHKVEGVTKVVHRDYPREPQTFTAQPYGQIQPHCP